MPDPGAADVQPEAVLETHVHAEHLIAAADLKQKLGTKTAIGAGVTEVQDYFGKVFNTGPGFATDGVTEAEFVERRNARDATLSMPRLILPPSEDNGVADLKIPPNPL